MFYGLKQLFLFSLVNFFSYNREKKEKTMLILRLDAIGDYILFRNFIEEIKKSEKYKNFKITLVGNIAWKELCEKLDKKYIDKFIWIDLKKMESSIYYKYKKIEEIISEGYDIVLNPVYSREFYSMDLIIKTIDANQKIGNCGNKINIGKWQKRIGDKYYTKLISTDNEIIFEFYRNKIFFEEILDKKLEINKPHIEIEDIEYKFKLPKNYSVIFIGAGSKNREWSILNFLKIAEYIRKSYHLDIVLCGSSSCIEDSHFFEKNFSKTCINLVGKTSLVDILRIVKNEIIMISNETSAPHFGIAIDGGHVIVISNGNNLGRFTPYPQEMTDRYHAVYHPKISENFEKYKILSNKDKSYELPDINEITVDMVKKEIDKTMKKVMENE